jgi:hypothetical protein
MKIFNQKLAIDCAIARIFVLSLFVAFSTNGRADTPSTTVVTLNGTAQGGVVSIMELLPIDAGFASVVTTQGESVEAVLNRLADEVCRSSVFNWRRPLQPRPEFVKVTGNTVTLPLSGLRYCFSGTDKGFVSLKPVLSVSGSYDAEKHQINMSWINPPETYDEIKVGSLTFPPSTTNCTYDCDPKKRKHMSFGLVTGKRGDDTSPPASIIINEDSQEELDTFPFYMGLAPNWSYWSDSTNAAAVICEQGIKTATEADAGVRGDPWDKPLYQSIRTTQGGVQGGVWRRFLGLKPGHTYKVETRLNTRQMDTCTNAWAFSFHAACDNPDGGGLTVAQMAGQAALPDGSSGSKAGRVALYEPGTTTKGQWKKRSTDVPGSGLEIKNLTLPKDVTSITVWLRCSGANSTGVGMDWIKLTDVTDKH